MTLYRINVDGTLGTQLWYETVEPGITSVMPYRAGSTLMCSPTGEVPTGCRNTAPCVCVRWVRGWHPR